MKKINVVLWIIITLFLFVVTCLHPRLHNIVLLMIAAVKCVMCIVHKESSEMRNMFRKTVFLLIAMIVIGYMTKIFDGVISYHAPYEYKADIHSLRTQYGAEKYAHFPDELPDSAFRVEWTCVPSMMQGAHCEDLFFYASQEYVSELYQYYAGQYPVYRYDEELGWSQIDGPDVIFPNAHNISHEEMYDIKAFVLYDTESHDHYQSGLYLNEEKGYVCFYAL